MRPFVNAVTQYLVSRRPQIFPPPPRDQPIDVYAENVAKQFKRNRPDSARSYLNDPVGIGTNVSDIGGYHSRSGSRFFDEMKDPADQRGTAHPSILFDAPAPGATRFSSSHPHHGTDDYPYPPSQFLPIPGPVASSSSRPSSSRAPELFPQQMRFDDEHEAVELKSDYKILSDSSRVPGIASLSSQFQDTGPHSHAILVRSSGESQSPIQYGHPDL